MFYIIWVTTRRWYPGPEWALEPFSKSGAPSPWRLLQRPHESVINAIECCSPDHRLAPVLLAPLVSRHSLQRTHHVSIYRSPHSSPLFAAPKLNNYCNPHLSSVLHLIFYPVIPIYSRQHSFVPGRLDTY